MGLSCGIISKDVEKPEKSETDIINDYINEALNKHNELRIRHNSPKLKINEKLNAIAQVYAKKLLDSQGEKSFPLNIYNDSILGENIFISKKITAEEICQNGMKKLNFIILI